MFSKFGAKKWLDKVRIDQQHRFRFAVSAVLWLDKVCIDQKTLFPICSDHSFGIWFNVRNGSGVVGVSRLHADARGIVLGLIFNFFSMVNLDAKIASSWRCSNCVWFVHFVWHDI